MDLAKVLSQLRAELENLNMAIASLERLATQSRTTQAEAGDEPRRPGRPRKSPPGVATGLAIHKRNK